jgi:predicted RNase H-like nuclease (RuvC/YqgF family)
VTFRAVALEAGVSRDFLYSNPDMRALVANIRTTATSTPTPATRANDSNITRLIRDRYTTELARRDNEIADLSRRLEAAHTEIHRLKRDLRRPQPRSPKVHSIDN